MLAIECVDQCSSPPTPPPSGSHPRRVPRGPCLTSTSELGRHALDASIVRRSCVVRPSLAVLLGLRTVLPAPRQQWRPRQALPPPMGRQNGSESAPSGDDQVLYACRTLLASFIPLSVLCGMLS